MILKSHVSSLTPRQGCPGGVEPTASTFTESRANPYTTHTMYAPTGSRTRTASLGTRRDFRFTIGGDHQLSSSGRRGNRTRKAHVLARPASNRFPSPVGWPFRFCFVFHEYPDQDSNPEHLGRNKA